MNYRFWSTLGTIGLGTLLAIPGYTSIGTELNQPTPVLPTREYLLAGCGGGRTVRARSPQDALVPYVIYPRNTSVLSDRPDLEWNSVPGSERYTVSLMNGDTVVWTKEVTDNEMSYPSEADALQPGIDYTLLIQASSGASSTEDDQPIFRLLSAPEAKVVQQAEALLASQPTTVETALLRANLYAGAGLYSESIKTLKALLAEGNQSPEVYRQLGDLYAESGLTLLAEDIYLQAIPLAKENLEEQANLQVALGELYEAIGENQESSRWLTQAKESYAKLGNQYQVSQLEQRL
jgi:tetratricopeptide (TPR) repeat protein